MAITATRLNPSPFLFDWTHLASASAEPDATRLQSTWDQLKSNLSRGDSGFYECADSEDYSQKSASVELARAVEKKGFTDCLFIGIGGSALGPLCLLESLAHRRSNALRFHILENPDPTHWNLTLKGLDPAKTLVCVVTKSGGTYETISQFLCALDWLGQERWSSQVVAITDPAKGDLKKFASDHSIPCLDIHPTVGGRFSVFTPVGLFPAALAGLDVDAFLKGASEVRAYCEKVETKKNALLSICDLLLRRFDSHPVHVCMPYSTRLRSIGDWFVQLWGESLGKDKKGFTPLAAVGATDQHSLLQLLRDGPDNHVTWFITPGEADDPVRIPAPSAKGSLLSSFQLLQGHTLGNLLETEYRAISQVMTNNSRPNFSIQLERLDERNMGALFFSFAVMTAFMGTLWDVNPFDQPGVEEGKVLIRDQLNRTKSASSMEDDPTLL